MLDLLQTDKLGQEGPGSVDGNVAPRDQAESVAEAIIRHQDLCTTGKITAMGQLLQLATIFGKLNILRLSYQIQSRSVD